MAKSKKKTVSKKRKPAPAGLLAKISSGLSEVTDQLSPLFTDPEDVVAAIKQDHDGLREYLDILKDTDREMTERRRAYVQFATLLKSHSVSEEKAVYAPTMKLVGHDLHIKVAEGYAEHQLADDLMKRIERTKDALNWSAQVNVLAEIVEHHVKEEERSMLPLIRKKASSKQNMDMLIAFIQLRAKTQKSLSPKNAGVLDKPSAS